MIDGLSTLFNSFASLLNPAVEFIIWIFPLKIYWLHDGEGGVILTFGKTRDWRKHNVGPGVVICSICETMKKTQVTGRYTDMPEQCLYSKDKFPLIVNLAVIYDIVDVTLALLKAETLGNMVEGIAMDNAREFARTHLLIDIVQRKDIGRAVIKDSNEELAKWGVKITDLMLTDLRPHNIMLIGEMLDKINKVGINLSLQRREKTSEQ